jgi:hypothetical protein
LRVLEAQKQDIKTYTTNLKALEQKRDQMATDHARKAEDVEVWTKRLEGVGAGVSGVGEGIAKLWVPPAADSAAAKAKLEQMMVPKPGERGNALRDAYRALVKEAESQAEECKTKLAALQRSQQAAASEVAGITQALTSLSELSRVSAQLSGALDVRIRRHLQDMAARARDMMQKSLYHFIMAFRYEYAEDVPPELYRIDAIVDAFAELAGFGADGKPRMTSDGKPMTLNTLPEAEYVAFDARAVKSEMLKIAGQIIGKLVGGGERTADHVDIELASDRPGGELLATLSKERSVKVSIPKDLYVFPKYNCQGLRITSIAVAENGIVLKKSANTPKAFDLKLTFWAPKQTVIYERTSDHPDGAYFFFTKGERDYEMTWSSTYRRSSDGKSTITSATTVREILLGKILGTDIKLRDYLPGVYGPPLIITAEILAAPDFIFDIAMLKFVINYEATHEPAPEERRMVPAGH